MLGFADAMIIPKATKKLPSQTTVQTDQRIHWVDREHVAKSQTYACRFLVDSGPASCRCSLAHTQAHTVLYRLYHGLWLYIVCVQYCTCLRTVLYVQYLGISIFLGVPESAIEVD